MKLSLRFAMVMMLILLLAGGVGVQGIQAQSAPGEEYFARYGHYVRGAFLEKYTSVPNPDELFGAPISKAFVSLSTGRLVQYFEKVRFEAAGQAGVQISNLGELVREPVKTIPLIENSAACQMFPQTGFQVCYAFLDFFNANGGVEQFGLPISNIEHRPDGQIVQYFQKALLERRSGLPAGKRITVASLGRIAFYQLGEDPSELAAERETRIGGGGDKENITALKVRAYPKSAVMPRSGYQTIYVIVQDQRLLSVYGATVELKVTLPDGEPQRYILPGVTGERGILQYTFSYDIRSVGIATVEVFVRLGDKLKGQTSTSFRIWW